jgi:hypothetical protein
VDVRELLPQSFGDRPLVRRLQVGEEQADGDRLRPDPPALGGDPLELVVGERLDHAVAPDALGHLDPVALGDQRSRLRRAQPVQVRAVLASDVQQVGEPAGRHERGSGPLFGQQRVGADRHPVRETLDVF